jgi:hypothetical protein
MLNVSVHYADLERGTRHRVTYDEGVAEGAVLSPDGRVLYSGTTRAREPAFLTMVSGPAVPAFLGFVAEPSLHDQLSAKRLAMIGNGDVIAVDSDFGLRGRIVGSRRPLAKRANPAVGGGSYRVVACSMSPDGTDMAVAMNAPVGSWIVLLHRPPRAVPPPAAVRATPTPPGAAALSASPISSVDRVIQSRRGGNVTVQLSGELDQGEFRVAFDNFSPDGVFIFGGNASFQTGGGGFRHVADVRRVNLESQEEQRVFYAADMQVDWPTEGAAGTEGPLATGGTISSLSRSGDCTAAWDGTTFAR